MVDDIDYYLKKKVKKGFVDETIRQTIKLTFLYVDILQSTGQ